MAASGPVQLVLTTLVMATILVVAAASPAQAQDEGAAASWMLFPSGKLYPASIADPQRSGFGVAVVGLPETEIPDAGSMRVALNLGGRFGLVRFTPRGSTELRFHLALEVGFHGLFDIDNTLDNIGWDGVYGLQVTARLGPRLAVKTGTRHTSSHVGDEYAERTGRTRIGYTREEVLAALSWHARPEDRVYVELGWAYGLGNPDLQARGRAQAGLEHIGSKAVLGDQWTWYAAVDLSATEERDWDLDPAVHAGLLLRRGDRRWRVGLGWCEGRTPIGEFFTHDESTVILGLWLDV